MSCENSSGYIKHARGLIRGGVSYRSLTWWKRHWPHNILQWCCIVDMLGLGLLVLPTPMCLRLNILDLDISGVSLPSPHELTEFCVERVLSAIVKTLLIKLWNWLPCVQERSMVGIQVAVDHIASVSYYTVTVCWILSIIEKTLHRKVLSEQILSPCKMIEGEIHFLNLGSRFIVVAYFGNVNGGVTRESAFLYSCS